MAIGGDRLVSAKLGWEIGDGQLEIQMGTTSSEHVSLRGLFECRVMRSTGAPISLPHFCCAVLVMLRRAGDATASLKNGPPGSDNSGTKGRRRAPWRKYAPRRPSGRKSEDAQFCVQLTQAPVAQLSLPSAKAPT